ncbi:MAG TPA: hypothetical protein PK177_19245 [Burkholderiaceae bacterium]|nr:hypothetical protein [Burkholderiaceae bacterium]
MNPEVPAGDSPPTGQRAAAADGASPTPAQPRSTEAQRLVYARTGAGETELAARERPLSGSARRLLMLIDGRRTVGLLSNFVRTGELDALLAELFEQRLIVSAGVAEPPDEQSRLARQQAEQASLMAARKQLDRLFEREFGTAGHVWDARVADCVNMEVLRRVLREVVDVIYYRHGEAAARRIVAAVRPIFELRHPD